MWTNNKEAELEQLTKRVAELQTERNESFKKVQGAFVRAAIPQVGSGAIDGLAEKFSQGLIDNAAEIRNALLPFDKSLAVVLLPPTLPGMPPALSKVPPLGTVEPTLIPPWMKEQ